MPHLTNKWTIHVVILLAEADERKLRFSELKNGIDGISHKMLVATLRWLECNGLVTRHVFPEVPPRVEYRLTTLGLGMLQSMKSFMDWMHDSWPVIRESRERYRGMSSARELS